MRKLCFALILAAAGAVSGLAQQAEVNVDRIGPKVGEVVPDFEAPDQHGVPRRLSALLGSKGALLVFYRSAEW